VLVLSNKYHLKLLEKGVDSWNKWRKENHYIKPDFSKANLSEKCLNKADLSRAKLIGANLTEADMILACLVGANLHEADMSATRIIKVKLDRATLTSCRVFGISAWGLTGLEEAEQSDLVITPEGETPVRVDSLEVAQFIYLLLHNEKIRDVINTVGRKGVLILGRFGERKPVLEAIRMKLRDLGYVPIVFDFVRPTDRDFAETIMTLAGMSRFIIADITKPKSVPFELEAIVPNYEIPMVTIIERGEEAFALFETLWRKCNDWVLDPLTYDSIEHLQRIFQKAIVDPGNSRLLTLRMKKAEKLRYRDASDYD
jgi:hypothetical protein